MPELCEWCFSDFQVVRSDEVRLDFLPLVRGVEVAPRGVGKERVLTKGLLVVVEP